MKPEKSRVCVFYHYYEKDHSYLDNLLHFINFGIHEQADFFIIVSGGECSDLGLEQIPNIRIVQAPNRNYDYGGYSYVLRRFVDVLDYDYFFFVNSSVRGPFIPPYLLHERPWFEYFIDKFGDDVGLVGGSINILKKESRHSRNYSHYYGEASSLAHVQSSVFTLSQQALQYLLERGFFDPNVSWTRDEVISKYEIRLSRLLVEAGYNIKCLLPEYNELDYRLDIDIDLNCSARNGDGLHPGQYFGRTVHPYEIMFIKTARNLWPISYLKSLAYSMAIHYPPIIPWSQFDLTDEDIKNSYQWFAPKAPLSHRLLQGLKKRLWS